MPPVYVLNHPPHPFWDFVQEMNDHPFFRQTPPPQPPQAEQAEASRSAGEQPTAAEHTAPNPDDDPPMVDPATLRADAREQWRRERCARRQERQDARDTRRAQRETGRRGGWPGFVPPFMMGAEMFSGRPGPHGPHGPHGHHGPPGPPPHFGFRGRGGHHHHHRGGHPHHHGGPRGFHAGHEGSPEAGFNLGKFLNDLGNKIGIDLNNAAEGLGLDRFMPSNISPDVDFEPKVDIFDLATQYVVHASLPGAKKDDVGVDWDGEHSVLRLAGVVHRPSADEEMLQHLAVDGRKREVGVFEKAIRLGTQSEPASIDVAGIKAKMTDGVLIVHVPKVEKEHHKRDVPITGTSPSPPRYSQSFDYDDADMYDVSEAVQTQHPVLQPQTGTGDRSRTVSPELMERTLPVREAPASIVPEPTKSEFQQPPQEVPNTNKTEATNEKQITKEDELQRHDTFDKEVDDWERSDSEEEGEYVKINVE